MINNFNPAIHNGKGDTPIRVLVLGITGWFENLSASARSKLVEISHQNKVNPQIKYYVGGPVISPAMDNERIIQLSEGFCCYVWMMSYNILVLSNSFARILEDESTRIIHEKYGQAALNLYQYASKPPKRYLDWIATGLPNPECHSDDAIEQDYIGKTNAGFLSAISFILCHECAHGALDHVARNEGVVKKLHDREYAADQFAVDIFHTAIQEQPNMTATYSFGLVIAFCAIFFLAGPGKSLTHPATLDRLKKALEAVVVDGDSMMWAYATIGVSLWGYQRMLPIHIEGKETLKDIFYEIVRQVEQITG